MSAAADLRPNDGGRAASRRTEVIFWSAVGVGLVGLIWSIACAVPGVPWNPARLAPSFALARGLPIYALRETGAHLGWIYGPVFPLWYLPFGLLENPTVALVLAAGWNALTMILPVVLVLWVGLGAQMWVVVRVTLCGTLLLLANPTTLAGFYFLHVDAVCVACVLLACVALHARVWRGWQAGLPMAALAATLAIGSKQLAVIFVPASIIWLWREGHGRLVRAWLFWLVVGGGGLAGIFLFTFGAEELVFNLYLFHARNPWQGTWTLLGARMFELAGDCWVWGVAVLIGVLVVRRRQRAPLDPASGSMARLLGWAALWQLPVGLIATLKVGGGLNSVHALVYALAAGLIVLGAAITKHDADQRDGQRTWRTNWLLPGIVGLLIVVIGVRLVAKKQVVLMPDRGLEQLVAESKANPGKRYYPWNPLITIISDRKVYPFDDALKCLWIAQLEPPVEAIRAAIPAGAVIFYQEPSQSKFVLNYLGPELRPTANPKREP